MRKFLAADLLCGAGGSSTGLARALRELGVTNWELVCVNHWPVAIETHERNHPEARHYCQDISTVRPHIVVPEGYLDLLMASPTCTHHSVARGGKPTSDQQRSDPWHIVTWLTELRVKGEANRGQFDPTPMHGYRRCDNHAYEWPRHTDVQNFGTDADRWSGDLTTRRVGKKRAGRKLDGVEHDGIPAGAAMKFDPLDRKRGSR